MTMTSARLCLIRNLTTASKALWSACARGREMWGSFTPMTSWRNTRPSVESLISYARIKGTSWIGTILTRLTVTWQRNILRYVLCTWKPWFELSRDTFRFGYNSSRNALSPVTQYFSQVLGKPTTCSSIFALWNSESALFKTKTGRGMLDVSSKEDQNEATQQTSPVSSSPLQL